ncbi:MAG: MarC family protein [Nitrososphaerales archaeon]|nr:MarC family protein [Nitrososphaerales archaeon]
MQHDFISFFQAFLTLFAIFDPIGALPFFTSLMANLPRSSHGRIIRTSCIVSLGILLTFAYLGFWLFKLLNITLSDFKIIGGIILLVFAVSYVIGREHEKVLPSAGESIAIFPLATPLLAGPGSISIVMLMVNPPFGPLTTFVVIVLNVILAWIILSLGMHIYKLLGKQGSSVISRIMGLIIGAVAIRLIREGFIEVIREII